jgi:2-dehydro-3-deoxyphosphogluconate aldolase/(4S)-4-hydroxy-2-oxoglutarate aldolase
MTQREDLFVHVTRNVIVGVVREDSADAAWQVARCYVENGIRTLEFTLTTPDALAMMQRARESFPPEVVIAAGTVRGGNDAADARRAGAQILVSPHTSIRVIDYAIEHDLLCIAGAATATEMINAWEAGASIIKVYPAPQLGGPDFFRAVRQPIRDIPMLAGGPVTIESIEAYLAAGAVAVNLGGSLAVPSLVAASDWSSISERVKRAVAIVSSNHIDAPTVVH